MRRITITNLVVTVIASLLTACTTQSLPAPTSIPVVLPTYTPTLTVVVPPTAVPTSTLIVPPAAEPSWLSILYPERGEILLQSKYDAEDEFFGTKSSVCMEIDAADLVEAGDYWEADDVVERTVVFVDGVQRYQSGEVWDYIVGHLFDDRDVGGPFAFCVSAPVGIGVHRVDISFKKRSGITSVFSWSFEIVESSIPTATPLPTPSFTDEQGNLPPYLRAVYPMPGQVVSLEKYVNIPPEDKTVWKGSDINQKAICIAFRIDKLKEVGSLPKDDRDLPSRIYVKVDEKLRENWLNPYGTYTVFRGNRTHCMPGELTPGHHSVTIYIHPYDKDLVMYSWGFTITK